MIKLQAGAAVFLFLLGCVVQVLGVVWFEQVDAWYADWGVGLVLSITGAVIGLYVFPSFTQKTYALEPPPPLSSTAYKQALASVALPAWTCNRCKLVEQGDALGSCVYCDSSMEFLQLVSEDERETALAAAT
jgi:hypothetical protein